MTEEASIQRSLVEQIFDEMFADIEGQEVFDEQVIQELKQLAVSGEMKKPANVAEVIKSASGRKP